MTSTLSYSFKHFHSIPSSSAIFYIHYASEIDPSESMYVERYEIQAYIP